MRTEGQRLLLAAPATIVEVASRVGVSKQVVSCWRRGAKLPSASARVALLEEFDIEVAAWESRPGRTPGAPVASKASPAKPPRLLEQVMGGGDDDLDGSSSTDLRELDELLSWLREQRLDGELSASARVRYAEGEARAIALRAKLHRERELLEDRIVKQAPFWRRIKAALLAALGPHPDAMRAVAQALGDLEAG